MDKLISFYNHLVAAYTVPGLLLVLAILGLLGVQLWYWTGVYARIHSFRNMRREGSQSETPAVSVIVVVRDEYGYLTETLPLLLTQQYEYYEVVVVDMSSETESSDALAMLRQQYPHLHVTRLVQQEQRARISQKMALNLGIKAASYPNLLLTTTHARPASQKWLGLMAKGFRNGQVVIGYCGIEPAPGLANRLMRAGRLSTSIRFLSSAIRGRTYRGTNQNIGYSAGLYFEAKGFDHLNMDAGADDLFIQRIADRYNTSIVLNPSATVRQRVWDGTGEWFRRLAEERSTWRHYPRWARNYIAWETGSRTLLLLTCGTAIAYMPFEIAVGAGALLLLRLGIVELQVGRICRRLGERGLMWAYLLYDLFSPLYDGLLWFTGLFRRSAQWK